MGVQKNKNQNEIYIYESLKSFISYVESIKAELQQIDYKTNNKGTSEIVRATETATKEIMDSCDNISLIQDKIKEKLLSSKSSSDPDIMADIENLFSESNNHIINIYQSCTFQDITGQKIQKIINIINDLHCQVLKLVISTKIGDEYIKSLCEIMDKNCDICSCNLPAESKLGQKDIDSLIKNNLK